ncbi:hypothetical protein FACS1894201_06730 [Bacteroidia bacterium]|nr:hypothetical protein FACS1894201_06730 [Bacteroidia bacterium]
MFTELLQATTETTTKGNGMTNILFLVAIIAIFYLFMIRPQQKRNKEQRQFRSSLQKGLKIVTIGGIHGKISDVQETTVTIEVEGGVHLKMEKSAIAANYTEQQLPEGSK